jgi:hypothetical protein
MYTKRRSENKMIDDEDEKLKKMRGFFVWYSISMGFGMVMVIRGLFRSQIFPQIPLCKKKILHHIKMPAHVWSTKCR